MLAGVGATAGVGGTAGAGVAQIRQSL